MIDIAIIIVVALCPIPIERHAESLADVIANRTIDVQRAEIRQEFVRRQRERR